MKQSNCYKNSQMTCLSCHNPHVSVKVTSADQFNSACVNCHQQPAKECLLPLNQRQAAKNNCYQCHMLVSETIDIPHVTVHDHRISIPVSAGERESIIKFVKLECLTDEHPSDLLMAKGYLQTFEAFSEQSFLLDSAFYYLTRIQEKDNRDFFSTMIRFYFLKKNYLDLINYVTEKIEKTDNPDAWTNYRIGEAYFQTGNYTEAEKYFSNAVSIQSSNPEFINKHGSSLMALNKIEEAQKSFQQCYTLNSKFAPALNNLGYTYLIQSDYVYAGKLIDKALALEPDYEQALLNKAAILIANKEKKEAVKYLQRVLKINPENEKAKIALQQIVM